MKQFGLEEKVQELEESSATVELAAHALGTQPAPHRENPVLSGGEAPILVVAAGDAKIDNAKYKAKFHQKAKMLTPDQAVELVGHLVGGVCPFAVKEGCGSIWTSPSSGLRPCSLPAEAAIPPLS